MKITLNTENTKNWNRLRINYAKNLKPYQLKLNKIYKFRGVAINIEIEKGSKAN